MARGRSNESVMRSPLSDNLQEKAGSDISLVFLAYFGLIVQWERNLVGTTSNTVAMIVGSNDSPLNLVSDTDIRWNFSGQREY